MGVWPSLYGYRLQSISGKLGTVMDNHSDSDSVEKSFFFNFLQVFTYVPDIAPSGTCRLVDRVLFFHLTLWRAKYI